MSYKLNKTDGSILTDLVDGTVDTTSSDLTLIGKNYSGFGEFLNENFIKVLENFSNSSAPLNPIRGQLWYDTSENKLKIYNGSQFTSSGGTTVSATIPNAVAVTFGLILQDSSCISLTAQVTQYWQALFILALN